MATPENEIQLDWTSRTVWGSVGKTHHAGVTLANGDDVRLTCDQPRKGYWVLRGWVNGEFTVFREDTTLKGVKGQATSFINAMAASLAEIREAADAASTPEEAADGDLTALQPVPARLVQHDPAKATRAVLWLQWRQRRTCPCPTPLHTMRCGQGAAA